MLIALYWHRIGRGWFWVSLLLCGVMISGLGRIAWAAHDVGIGTNAQLYATLFAVAASLVVVIGGLFVPAWTRASAVTACLAVYACFGLTTAPLNGASGHYESQTVLKLHGARIAIPSSFNSQFERFQFLLPGNRFLPYDGESRAPAGTPSESSNKELAHLLATHDAVAWLQADVSEQTPPCVPHCTVLGSRWEVKGRHQSGEITGANIWYPQSWLFRREWLLTNDVRLSTDAQR
jgi:hypothetical protein